MALTLDGTNGITFNNSTVQASAGSVLQVVQGSYSTSVANITNTYADTNLTATITPKFNTSKILILISHPSCQKNTANVANDINFNLAKNGTQLIEWGYGLGYTGTAVFQTFSTSFNYLDSPATISATTYKTQFKNADNNGSGVTVQVGNFPSTITLMEIAA